MSISTVGGVGGLAGVGGLGGGYGTRGIGGVSGVSGVSGAGYDAPDVGGTAAAEGFGAELAKGIDGVSQAQGKADDLAVKAASGDLRDVHDYMIASNQAQLATQLTVAVRNKAVEAFQEIMRMPV